MKKTFSILSMIFASLGLVGGLCCVIGIIIGFTNPVNVECVEAFIRGSFIATLVCTVFCEACEALSKNHED